MLNSLTKLTRKVAFTAALLVGVAGFASNANAAAGDAQAITTAGSSVALQAPFTTVFTPGYGQQVRLNVTLDAGTQAEVDFMALYAFLYQNGTYVGAIRSDTATSGANAKTQVVLLPANSSPFTYNQVAFAYLNVGADGGITANATPDTLNGTAMTTRVLRIRPDQITSRTGAAGVGLSAVAVAAYTATSAASGPSSANVTAGQLASIGGSLNSNLINMTTYAGPVLTSAGTNVLLNGTDVKLTFNASLDSIGDNNTVAVAGLQLDVNDNVGRVTAAQTQGAVSAGATIARFDDTNAFDNTLVSIDLNAIALGSCTANYIRDEAGNCAAPVTAFAISTFAQPAFATSGTAKVLSTGGTAISDDAELLEFNSTTGTGNNGETFVLTGRVAENFNGTGANNIADFTITPAAASAIASVSASGANTNTFGLTLTLGAEAQAIRVNTTSGVLEFTSDDTANPIVWTPITVALAVQGGSALTTAESVALTTATSAVSVYNSLASTPTVATLDSLNGTAAGVDGILDGVKVDFIEDVGTLNSTGFSIFDRVTPATTTTPTVAISATDASVVNVSAAQSVLYGAACNAGFLEASQTCATNANTASVSATPIPYDFSLTSATSTYARVYNATTGALATLPNIAAAGTISDGAAPVVIKVSRQLGEVADPEGSLVMTFSEGLSVNPSTGFVRTQNGSLSLDVLNDIDDGGAVPATGTRSQLSVTVGGVVYNVANNTATFADVDNTVLSALTSVGITAGNSGGNGFRDAAGNFSGTHVITPDATTTITTLAPTFDRAVVVLDASRRITNVLAFVTENVTYVGTNLNERFAISFGGTVVTPSAATVTGNVVNLTLPGTGVALRQVEGATVTLEYTDSTVNFLRDSDLNVLDDTPSPELTTADRSFVLPVNTNELFSMEIRGTITTDGTAAVAQGTLVRADLVRAESPRIVERATATVPCNCSAGTQQNVSLTGLSGLDTAMYNATARGATSIPVYINVSHVNSQAGDNTGGTAVRAALFTTAQNPANSNTTEYVASLNVSTGAITATGTGLSGQVFFREGPMQLVDAVDGNTTFDNDSYAVVNGSTGAFRLNVGTNSAPLAGGDQFVIISVRRNGTTTSSWVPVTFADKSLAGYLPFGQDVKTTVTAGQSDSPFIDFQNVGGSNGSVTAAFRLDRILSVDLADTTNYQLVGTAGQIARATGTGTDFNAYRFFTTINTTSGAPYSLWGANNEAFTLITNGVKSAFQLGNFTVDNIKSAWGSGFGIAYRDAANRVVVTAQDTLFYPVTANTATAFSAPAGWHLLTVQANQASPGNLGNTTTDNTAVGMIIEAGARRNGDAAGAVRSEVRTWIRGATENSLTALEAGKAYFVYLNAADSAFTGQ